MSYLHQLHSFIYYRRQYGIVLLHVLLRQFEERTFCFIHHIFNVISFVKNLLPHITDIVNHLSCQILFCHNIGIILNIGRGRNHRTEFSNISRTTHLIKFPHLSKFICHSQYIHRTLIHTETLNGIIHHLVFGVIETLWNQLIAHLHIGIFVYHQGSKHGFLHLNRLRLHMSIFYRNSPTPHITTICSSLFGHILYIFFDSPYNSFRS